MATHSTGTLIPLPKEILKIIFNSDLQWRDLINVSLTSKRMKRLMSKIKVKTALVLKEHQLAKLYEITKIHPGVSTNNVLRYSAVKVVIDYDDSSRKLLVKHVYCLLSSLFSVRSLLIKHEGAQPNQKQILEIMMSKYKSIELIISKKKYLEWISVYDSIKNDRKFNIHLSYYPKTNNTDILDKGLAFYEESTEEEESAIIVNKRALDLIVTPPEFKKQRTNLTETYKRMLWDTEKGKVRLKTDSITFPDALTKFLNPFDIYELYNDVFKLDETDIYSHKEAIESKLFKPVGEKFIHCIITSNDDDDKGSWVLLTEIDIFISNRQDLDSCSYPVETEEMSNFSINIKKDKNQGRGYSELTLQAGHFQILAAGGIYGNKDTVLGGFLGSSIPLGILGSYTECYTLKQQKEYVSFYRHLRDYTKHGASYFAGFKSTLFSHHGFTGSHPLTHYLDDTSNYSNLSVLASRILCNYVTKRVTKGDLVEHVQEFLKSRAMKDVPHDMKKGIMTVAGVEKAISEHNIKLADFSITILSKLKVMENALNNSDGPIDINLYDFESGNKKNTKLRDLVNGGLSKSIKNQNQKIVKKFIEKYAKAGLSW